LDGRKKKRRGGRSITIGALERYLSLKSERESWGRQADGLNSVKQFGKREERPGEEGKTKQNSSLGGKNEWGFNSLE